MNGSLRAIRQSRISSAFSAALCAALLVLLTLAASPQLHEKLHHDAGRADHHCAVTMLLENGLHDGGAPSLVEAQALPVLSSELPASAGQKLGALFLIAAVFEHAPPVA